MEAREKRDRRGYWKYNSTLVLLLDYVQNNTYRADNIAIEHNDIVHLNYSVTIMGTKLSRSKILKLKMTIVEIFEFWRTHFTNSRELS